MNFSCEQNNLMKNLCHITFDTNVLTRPKRIFVMFEHCCENLSRKTFYTNVLKNMLFRLPKVRIDFYGCLLHKNITFAMFVRFCEKSCHKTFDPNVKRKVIWTPQVLNRFLWLLILKHITLTMFVQSCEMLCRQTFETEVLRNVIFGLP